MKELRGQKWRMVVRYKEPEQILTVDSTKAQRNRETADAGQHRGTKEFSRY